MNDKRHGGKSLIAKAERVLVSYYLTGILVTTGRMMNGAKKVMAQQSVKVYLSLQNFSRLRIRILK